MQRNYTKADDELIYAEIVKQKSVKRAAECLASVLGRTANSIQSRYTSIIRHTFPPIDLDVNRGVSCHQEPLEIKFKIPEKVMAERDRRLAARMVQPEVSRLLGDPPPGYSALDRQRAGA